MNLTFSIVAEAEITAAADYYERQEAGLGLRFLEELNRAITLVLIPECLDAAFERLAPLLAAALSLPHHLFRATKHGHDSNSR